jgi:hypothetical protein
LSAGAGEFGRDDEIREKEKRKKKKGTKEWTRD